MPQFQLITEGATDWDSLDEVTQGFIEAMFFTNQCSTSVALDFSGDSVESYHICTWPRSDAPAFIKADWSHPEIQAAIREGQSDGEIPSDAGVADLHPDSLKYADTFVQSFLSANRALYEAALTQEDYNEERFGNDLWYTSQGHGVGFQCRDELEADIDGKTLGERLSEAARYNEMYPAYCDVSGKIHLN